MVCLFVIFSQNYMIHGDRKQFLNLLLVFVCYSFVGLLFSIQIKPFMIEFMLSMSTDMDSIQEAVAGLQLEANPQTTPEEKKEKKDIEIPEFLFKYSSTFFKTATKKDILFKKLFNHKKSLSKTDKSTSERQKPSSSSNISPTSGKAVKKVDMSMINFHLNVKDNQELLKHYR